MKNKNFLKWPLIIGIAVVLNLFFAYAIKVAYPGQEREDFCPREQKIEKIETAEECIKQGGQWDESFVRPNPSGSPTSGEGLNERGYCNREFICAQKYQDFREGYERNVFIILVVLGALTLGASFLSHFNQVLSTAFSFGGVLTFVVASIRYWELAPDWLHLLILGIALASLIWLGVKKFQEMKD